MNDQPSPENDLALAPESDRFVRQADLVPWEELAKHPVAIIGCGAIGRQVGIQLAAIGAKDITIIDFDGVTPTNVTTQGFLATDVGKEKVHALEEAILAIDPSIRVTSVCDRYRLRMELPPVVFLCVDSIEARKFIWDAIKDKVKLVIDGRMLGETMRVLAVCDDESKTHYETTFFPPEQAEHGRCTAHATIYTGSIAGGLMVHQFTRFLRGMPIDCDMSLNLLAGELMPVG